MRVSTFLFANLKCESLFLKKTRMRKVTLIDDESEDGSSAVYNPRIENPSRHFVDLRQSIKDKINRNEIFYSFEIVSVKKSKTSYQRFVQ